ncbi:MAG: hypothetical protein HZA16_09175 [Nitrospirae bacterium]|nr:hypothetical protein [Nitrospirota bacterium]
MTTRFRILFTLSIAHVYYNAACRDFDFVLPSHTAALLRNGKLLAKARDWILYVLYEADEAGAALISADGKTLRIGLKLLNSCFSNFTDLAFDFQSANPIYRNAAAPGVLDAYR